MFYLLMEFRERTLQITGMGKNIPNIFFEEAEKAKKVVLGLRIGYGMAPKFSTPYHVDSPMVIYSVDGISMGRMYGKENGLALIGDLRSGKMFDREKDLDEVGFFERYKNNRKR